jgi:hypothetical protein
MVGTVEFAMATGAVKGGTVVTGATVAVVGVMTGAGVKSPIVASTGEPVGSASWDRRNESTGVLGSLQSITRF